MELLGGGGNPTTLQGLGLSEDDIKALFGYFDVDGSGEIDFSEFRRFLQGGTQQTGLAVRISTMLSPSMLASRRRFAVIVLVYSR